MQNNIHRLKLVQPYFDEVASGIKTFEVRVNDREYKVGDILELLEYDPNEQPSLTNRSVRVCITYILDDPRYVLPGMVIMAVGATDTPPEWANQVEMYLLTHPARDPFQLRVVNNVNLPNHPDFETLVEEWIVDNYGSLDGWEYHCLSHTEVIAIGADTDAPE